MRLDALLNESLLNADRDNTLSHVNLYQLRFDETAEWLSSYPEKGKGPGGGPQTLFGRADDLSVTYPWVMLGQT